MTDNEKAESTRAQNLAYKHGNIIRIAENEMDRPIFRVYPKNRLLDVLRTGRNALVKPRLWDDPFENFILQSTAYTESGQPVSLGFLRENYYGQCWTLTEEETDALWRIYSPNKDGFCVKTTIRKLFDQFYDPNHHAAMVAFYIGRIQYDTKENINAFFEDPDNLTGALTDTSGRGTVATLLIKRTEFRHENEVRLIAAAHPAWYEVHNLVYEFPIDVSHTFDEIVADPRMDDTDPNAFITSLNEIRALGFHNPVRKSTLYQLPNLHLRLNI